jgi:predicted GIY-YIG superfamily endonuclease
MASASSASSEYIYVLKLEHQKYYVGKSKSPSKRITEHTSGKGSVWTSLHKPISVESTTPCSSPFDEDKITKEWMSLKGIDNVRGGSYVEIELDPLKRQVLQTEIWASTGCCSRCGRKGHFVKKCFSTTDVYGNPIESFIIDDSSDEVVVCYRCGRKGHYANRCYARTHISGYRL